MSQFNHGKARTVLKRSSDLAVPHSDEDRSAHRDANGRFAPGNGISRGKGWKRAIAKGLGRVEGDPVAVAVANAARTLFNAGIRELPSDGPTVRGLLAQKARHEALAGFWSAESVRLGLTSPEGIAAQEHATRHGVRSERLAVTIVDLATRFAAARKPSMNAHDALLVAVSDSANDTSKETP